MIIFLFSVTKYAYTLQQSQLISPLLNVLVNHHQYYLWLFLSHAFPHHNKINCLWNIAVPLSPRYHQKILFVHGLDGKSLHDVCIIFVQILILNIFTACGCVTIQAFLSARNVKFNFAIKNAKKKNFVCTSSNCNIYMNELNLYLYFVP